MMSFCNYLNVLLQRRRTTSGDLRRDVTADKLISHFRNRFNYSLCEDIDTADCASCRQRVMSYIKQSHCYCHSPNHTSKLSSKTLYFDALCDHCLCRFVVTEFIVFPANFPEISQGFKIYRELAKRDRNLHAIMNEKGETSSDRNKIDQYTSKLKRTSNEIYLINDTMMHMKFDRDDHLSVTRYKSPCGKEKRNPVYIRSEEKQKCFCETCMESVWWEKPVKCSCKDHFNDEDLSKLCTKCLCHRLNQVAYNNDGYDYDTENVL
jgi:hypothetical protein